MNANERSGSEGAPAQQEETRAETSARLEREEDETRRFFAEHSDAYAACPHCGARIHMDPIACGVFTCGVQVGVGQLPPHCHASFPAELAQRGLLRGCGAQSCWNPDAKRLEACVGR